MKTILSLLILATVTLSSCQKQELPAGDLFDLPEKSAQLIEADNKFGLELFRKVAAEANPNDNTFVSPLSVAVALGMLYNGASGDTRTEMEKTLKLNGLTPDQINQAHKALLDALKSSDPEVVLEIANAIFYRQGTTVLERFKSTNRQFYDAEISALNFNNQEETLATINGWVANKTKDKIPTIIDEVPADLIMVLLNAVYFNGIWKHKFDGDKTHELPFRHGDGRWNQVEMMNQETSLEYTKNELFSAIHLPYGKDQFRMTVMLPNSTKTTADVMASMTLENWNTWMKAFKKEERVEVTMPRFKFSWDMELKTILANMGMPKAFIPFAADFSGINGAKDLVVGYVKHKTFIDVNENGTEAAAVTAIGVFTTSMPVEPPGKINFHVDRPFIFTITEKTTGIILFAGEIRAPVY
jgi:serine protease inhibitor